MNQKEANMTDIQKGAFWLVCILYAMCIMVIVWFYPNPERKANKEVSQVITCNTEGVICSDVVKYLPPDACYVNGGCR